MISEFRFRVDSADNEPGRSRCSGCRERVRVGDSRSESRCPAAFSESTDVYGRKHYWCRACTEAMYREK